MSLAQIQRREPVRRHLDVPNSPRYESDGCQKFGSSSGTVKSDGRRKPGSSAGVAASKFLKVPARDAARELADTRKPAMAAGAPEKEGVR